jgi:hypothetical protein
MRLLRENAKLPSELLIFSSNTTHLIGPERGARVQMRGLARDT